MHIGHTVGEGVHGFAKVGLPTVGFVAQQQEAALVLRCKVAHPSVVVAHHGQAHRAVLQQLGGGLLVVGLDIAHQVQAQAGTAQMHGDVCVRDATCAGDRLGQQDVQRLGHLAHQQQAPPCGVDAL